MSEILKKFKFIFGKKQAIVIVGRGRKLVQNAISKVIKNKEVLVFEREDKEIKECEFFLKNSDLGVLVVTHVGDIPPDKDYFAGEQNELENTIELAKRLPPRVFLVLNYDDETTREIADMTNLNCLTFGFSEKADFFATDIKFNRGVNFKVNHKGSIVPFWLEGTFGKEQIYTALATAAVGKIFGLNLVEISQLMREYQTLPGRMRLLEGIKNSFVLDDTESASIFSMIEAIEVLGKIPGFKRKIAVLGDVVGAGKYAIEAHQMIGEKVVKNTNLLFTFGPRAKFIAQGAIEKGMERERIFSYEKIEDGIEKLKELIRSGDLILVDGSREMKMSLIVDQIRKIW